MKTRADHKGQQLVFEMEMEFQPVQTLFYILLYSLESFFFFLGQFEVLKSDAAAH